MAFPEATSVKLKCDNICILVPTTKATTTLQLKRAFLEASAVLPELSTQSLGEDDIQLWKQSADDEGDELWLPMEKDSADIDKVGLDQGHVVGVSFADKHGKFPKPQIAIPEDMPMEPPPID